jgi:hypothetical protein
LKRFNDAGSKLIDRKMGLHNESKVNPDHELLQCIPAVVKGKDMLGENGLR